MYLFQPLTADTRRSITMIIPKEEEEEEEEYDNSIIFLMAELKSLCFPSG